jgi:tRNA pseudouridine55 synthase
MVENTQFDFPNGEVLLVDKEKNWTSFDLIRKLQSVTKYRKFGHAGTLDPLATGLVIICSGKKTKEIESYQAQKKTYIAQICFGASTESGDSEFEPNLVDNTPKISESDVKQIIPQFIGKILQTPSKYSAIKVQGKKAYLFAREGKDVVIPSREVEVYSLQLLNYDQNFDFVWKEKKYNFQMAEIKVECSKGTYIRSLGEDIAQKLGTTGFLSSLRRTKIGEFDVENAKKIDQICDQINH